MVQIWMAGDFVEEWVFELELVWCLFGFWLRFWKQSMGHAEKFRRFIGAGRKRWQEGMIGRINDW